MVPDERRQDQFDETGSGLGPYNGLAGCGVAAKQLLKQSCNQYDGDGGDTRGSGGARGATGRNSGMQLPQERQHGVLRPPVLRPQGRPLNELRS